MSKGKVEDYDPRRGYGSILDVDTGLHLAVYANYIKLKVGEMLSKGQDVSFEIENRRSESWAINVRILS